MTFGDASRNRYALAAHVLGTGALTALSWIATASGIRRADATGAQRCCTGPMAEPQMVRPWPVPARPAIFYSPLAHRIHDKR